MLFAGYMRGNLRASHTSGSKSIGRVRPKLQTIKEKSSKEWFISNGTILTQVSPLCLQSRVEHEGGDYAQEVGRVYPQRTVGTRRSPGNVAYRFDPEAKS